MSEHALQQPIEELWERRDPLSSATGGAGARRGRGGARPARQPARRASPSRPSGGWQVNQWLKKAVLLSFRLTRHRGDAEGPGGAPVWDKVPLKFAGWGENRFREAGFRAVPGRGRAPLGLHRAGRRADAELRQCRRLCRRGNTMVDTWATVGCCAQIGAQLPPLRRRRHRRRAGAAAGRPGDHRGRLLHRRPLRGGRGRDRRARLRCCRWACSSAPRPRSSTARPARSIIGRVPAYSVVVPGIAARQAAARRLARARRSTARSSSSASTSRPAPRPRSTNCCAIDRAMGRRPMPHRSALPLAQALIRCAARHAGRRGRAGRAGRRRCERARLHGDAAALTATIDNLFARIGDRRAAFLLRRPHRRGAGRRRGAGASIRSPARCATACCTAAAPAT